MLTTMLPPLPFLFNRRCYFPIFNFTHYNQHLPQAAIDGKRLHPTWTKEKALEYIQEQTGNYYDQLVGEPFLSAIQKGEV